METGLTRWRQRYTSARVPTIPLRPFDKAPVCKAWQQRAPGDQWNEVGHDEFRGNIGVLTGNGLAVIDADAPETAERIGNRLEALGLSLPTVQTASRTGRHYYVKVENAPEGNYTHLSPEVGPGELRYGPGAYVVAPCSLVDGNRYRFTDGSPERIPTLKPLSWNDLRWLVAPVTPQVIPELEAPPVRLIRRDAPHEARTLLYKLAATKGPTRPFEGYLSRSEAEAAVVSMLILAGWSLDEIRAEFAARRPGHFAEHPKPDRYLEYTYRYCLSTLAATPERSQIAATYSDAKRVPWPGRGGALEQRAYLALLAKAWQFDAWTVEASYRELAEHAAAGRSGTYNALARLEKSDLVAKAQAWRLDGTEAHATAWELKKSNTWTIDTYRQVVGAGGEALEAVAGEVVVEGVQEVWAPGRLGRSAGLVWEHLAGNPTSKAELARLTGKHPSTVTRALGVLEAHGLAQEVDGEWIRGPDTLETVARELGAAGAARRRRAIHNLEREAWHRQLQEGSDA